MNKMLDDVRAKLLTDLYQAGTRLRLVRCPEITGRYIKSSATQKGQVHIRWDDTDEESIVDATRVEPYHFICTTCRSPRRDPECYSCEQQRLDHDFVVYPQPFGSFP